MQEVIEESDINLYDFDKISSILFEEGMTWKSCDALFDAV